MLPKIDAEIHGIIPPLTDDEFAQLKANVLSEGIRDPLVVWAGHNILLDGHNRLEIIREYGLAFDTVEIDLPNRQAAINWIINNQLGRRNLTPTQASYLRGKRYEAEKLSHGGDRKSSGHFDHLKTADSLADELGVSEKTIRRDAQFSRAVDTVAEVAGDGAKKSILGRDAKFTKKDTVTVGKLAERNPEQAREVIDMVVSGEAKNLRDATRQWRKRDYERRIEETPLPQQKYRVLYADPPWNYGNSGLDEYGHAERHYDTMTISELCELEVADLAADDAVLFLWVTSPMLEDAFEVINAWGFQYKTSFVWDKVKHNFGYYNSVRHEFLLVCTRGSCLPDVKNLYDSVVEIKRSDRHSEKPSYFRELIESLYTDGRRIELFARNKADGWDTWGNER